MAKKKAWGFDTKNIDRSVRPQDDFFRYANGLWLKKNKIPPAESRWGTFIMLRYDTEQKLRGIMRGLLAKRHKKGTPGQLVADVYRSAADLKRRNALGAKPIEPYRRMIRAIESKEDLRKCLAALHRLGVDAFFGETVDQDAKQSEKNILYLFQGGLGMPDRDYYLKDTPEMKRVRGEYVKHVEKMFRLWGETPARAKANTATVMEIETRLAKASMDKVDTRDPEKTYHKKTLAEMERLYPETAWRPFIRRIGGTEKPLIVAQPRFFNEVDALFRDTPLASIKTYLEWQLLDDAASLLSSGFVRQNFHFYATVLTGVAKMKPLWRRALGAVNGSVGEALGKLYVERYFTPRAKRMMDALVSDLFAAYEERLRGLDWMSPATKRKALKKLGMMTRKIGYPKRFRTYGGLVIRPDDFAGNMYRVAEHEHRRVMRKLRRPVDRAEWYMTPQTVNAYFNPGMNEIVFPAAILQAPFFDEHADDAVNYGAIGYTIGHEITHGFDDQGSKFDGKGNLKHWWTSADRARFDKKASVLAKQFDSYEVADGLRVNGKLTLGENIADLGGISIAFDAYQRRLKKTGRKDIDGFTPEQRFFLGCAQGERELARPEFQKMLVTTDPHSPGEFRVNGPFSDMPEFYEAFGVRKGDGLYREPAKRAKIW
jgi:putative endopeptidase